MHNNTAVYTLSRTITLAEVYTLVPLQVELGVKPGVRLVSKQSGPIASIKQVNRGVKSGVRLASKQSGPIASIKQVNRGVKPAVC